MEGLDKIITLKGDMIVDTIETRLNKVID